MSFKPNDLVAIASCSAFTLWHYNTQDRIDSLFDVPTYFAEAAGTIHEGDGCFITARTAEGTVAGTLLMFPDLSVKQLTTDTTDTAKLLTTTDEGEKNV